MAAIAVLLCINLIKDPGYLSITYSSSTGAFVGNLVDILRAVAPLLMVATGHVPRHRDRAASTSRSAR